MQPTWGKPQQLFKQMQRQQMTTQDKKATWNNKKLN